jgi:hypothetical protein
MADFIATPRTEASMTRLDNTQAHLDFSIEDSFRAPDDRDNLFSKMRGARQPTASTPRNPLAARRNPNARNEFTPLLKSVTTNRQRQVNGLLDRKIATPAALKQGFVLGGTPLPEPSTFDAMNSSSISDSGVDGRTPVPDVNSSSAMSTPMALPNRGEGGLDNGNILTLREQEAVSENTARNGCMTDVA